MVRLGGMRTLEIGQTMYCLSVVQCFLLHVGMDI